MRKITLYIACTLDGYIARKDGSIDWLKKYEGGSDDYGYSKFYSQIDVVVMGSKTYKQVLTFGDFPHKDRPCYVFTTKKQKLNEYVTFIRDISLIKKMNKRIWLVGGSKLIKTFMKHDLIDEYVITILPETLGEGIPLFQSEVKLKLVESKSFKSGLVQLKYKKEK